LTIESIVFTVKKTADEEDQVYGEAPVDEEETYTITVNASALNHNWSKDGITYALGADNRLKIDFGVENQDSQWNLPDGVSIDVANIEGVAFNVCDQIGRHNLSIASAANGSTTKIETIQNQTGSPSFELIPGDAASGTINQIVLQAAGWDYTDENTLTIESIVFTVKKTADEEDQVYGEAPVDKEPTETFNITIYASALKHDWSQTGITHTLGTDNRLKIDFGVANNDSRFDLTNGNEEALSIDLASVEKVTFNVCDQDGRHNISLSMDGNKVGDPISNQTGSTSFVMVPTAKSGTINEVVLQAAGWDYTASNTLTIESVVFTMKKTAEDQEDVAYGVEPTEIVVDPTENITPDVKSELDKRFTHKEGGLTPQDATRCTPKEVEKVELSFNGAWDTIRFDLPEVIDLAKCTSVTFAISDQT
ncbi:MAG: hypothetical protein K2O34_06205, partial [Acetatifactor sp.]|nr:hypothetical protein [Acetatifactor sp.]